MKMEKRTGIDLAFIRGLKEFKYYGGRMRSGFL
jgi:hypothetical protein